VATASVLFAAVAFFVLGFAPSFTTAAFCALTAAQRFFVAAMIRFMPAALIFRFFAAAGADGAASAFLAKAHLFFCTAAIFRRAAALIVRLAGAAAAELTAGVVRGARIPSDHLISEILLSI